MIETLLNDYGSYMHAFLAAAGAMRETVWDYGQTHAPLSVFLLGAGLASGIISRSISLMLGGLLLACLVLALVALQPAPMRTFTVGLALAIFALLCFGVLRHQSRLRHAGHAFATLAAEHRDLQRQLTRERMWRDASQQSEASGLTGAERRAPPPARQDHPEYA